MLRPEPFPVVFYQESKDRTSNGVAIWTEANLLSPAQTYSQGLAVLFAFPLPRATGRMCLSLQYIRTVVTYCTACSRQPFNRLPSLDWGAMINWSHHGSQQCVFILRFHCYQPARLRCHFDGAVPLSHDAGRANALARGLQIFRTSRSVHNVRLVARCSYAKSGNHSAGGAEEPGKAIALPFRTDATGARGYWNILILIISSIPIIVGACRCR